MLDLEFMLNLTSGTRESHRDRGLVPSSDIHVSDYRIEYLESENRNGHEDG